jgi:colicin import membrane protein
MALKSARSKRSKVEVEEEFSQLAAAIADEKKFGSPKLDAATQIHEDDIRAAVSEITVEIISRKLSDLNLEISRTLSSLSEKLIYEVNLLKSLKEAVALESKELQRIHGVDIAATNIDVLVDEYSERKKILEAEIIQTREAWEKEKIEKELKEKEDAEILKKSRTRENEDYEYRKVLERKKFQDRFEEECRLKEKENRERQETLEKNWNDREAAIKVKEEEFAALKKEVEQFPNRLSSECAKVAKETSKEVEAKFSQEIANLKRDLIVEKQMSELKIKQLQESLATQQNQMSIWQTQLEEAKRQAQDVVVKALEGAAGAHALAHVNQIALEQAKNRMQP